MKHPGNRDASSLELGWLALVVLVPIMFSPLAIDPFEIPKSIAVFVLTLVLLCIFLFHHFRTGRRRTRRLPNPANIVGASTSRNGSIQVLTVGFLIVFGAASAQSIDPRASVWNSVQPVSSLLVTVCFLIVFHIVMHHGRQPWQQHRVLIAIVITSGPVVTYGALQALGIDIFSWRTDATSGMLSTLGRSNFFAAYLVMVIPITFYAISSKQRRIDRIGFGTLFVLQWICLMLTRARASWIGLLVGLVVIYLVAGKSFNLVQGRHAPVQRFFGVLILVASCILFLEVLAGDYVRTVSVSDRILLWKATVNMAADRWFLGYGPGSFPQAFASYYPAGLRTPGHAPYFLNPHNSVLDLVVSTGLIGLVVYLSFVAKVIHSGVRLATAASFRHQRLVLGVCLAAIVGLQVNNLFTPRTVTTELLFWVLAALMLGQTAQQVGNVAGKQQMDGC